MPAREYPFEQATASKFASILGPPAEPGDDGQENGNGRDESDDGDVTTTADATVNTAADSTVKIAVEETPAERTPREPAKKRRSRRTSSPSRHVSGDVPSQTGKPSAVHIPADLEPRIRAFQRKHGGTRALSNGKLLVWALADCHSRERLDDLVGARNVGGDVFGAWTMTATTDHDGPTFPFTVYLPASFYNTFDELVATHGAKSRSHLAGLAITDFLKEHEIRDEQ